MSLLNSGNLLVGNALSAAALARFVVSNRHNGITQPISIVVRHQPNVFAYWKLLGQIRLAGDLAANISSMGFRSEVSFVATDYDTWRDDRFRRAELPCMHQRRPYSYIHFKPERHLGSNIIIALSGQIPEIYDQYLAEHVVGTMSAMAGALGARAKRALRLATFDVLADVTKLLNQSQAWPEFVRSYIHYAAAWLGLGQIRVTSGFERLVAEQELVRGLVSQAKGSGLAWLLCSGCGSRFSPTGSIHCSQACPYCNKQWYYGHDIIIPKVVLDGVIDEFLDPGSIMLSHMGSLEHIIETHKLAQVFDTHNRCMHVVSDQGARSDYLSGAMTASSGARSFGSDAMAAVVRRAADGHYSSLYYLVADRFEKVMR